MYHLGLSGGPLFFMLIRTVLYMVYIPILIDFVGLRIFLCLFEFFFTR